MKKVLKVAILLSALFFQSIAPVFAAPVNNRCTWTVRGGRLTYCAGGFNSEADLRSSQVKLWCGGADCGGLLERIRNSISGSDSQMVPLNNFDVARDPSGKYYACFSGNFDEGVKGAIVDYINRKNASCIVGGVAAGGVGLLNWAGTATGGVVGTIALAAAGTAVCTQMFNDYKPIVYGTLVDQNRAEVCQSSVEIDLSIIDKHENRLLSGDSTFYVCNQIPDAAQKAKCQACSEKGGKDNVTGIWTAVGCIPTSQEGIVTTIIKIGLGLSGGFALLLIISAGFQLSISQGDPKKAGEAREHITSAVMGLLFIIFSVVILQFIGISILRIPGFGS
jgi:hypothetical protein